MRKLLCLLAGAALLAGCATTRMSDERYGYVHKIYAVGETPSGLPECLARLTSEQLDSGRFVEIKYGTMKLRKYLIAYASKEMSLSEHDKVIFNPSTCVGTEFPRIKPALPTDLMPPFKG